MQVVPRRPRSLEALDNTEDDPPVLWDVLLRPGYGVDATAFQNAVEADARTLPVPPEAQSDRIEGVRVLVRVSTQQQAWAIAEELANAGWLAAGPMALPPLDEPVQSRGYEVYPFAPDAPVLLGGGSIRTTPIVIELDE